MGDMGRNPCWMHLSEQAPERARRVHGRAYMSVHIYGLTGPSCLGTGFDLMGVWLLKHILTARALKYGTGMFPSGTIG